MSATVARTDKSHAARRWWVGLWLLLLVICAAAVWYVVAVFVPHERTAAIEVWRGRLSAMADDRKAAITSWLSNRLGDAKVVAEDPTALYLLSGQRTEPYLFPPEEGPRQHVQRLLDSMQGAHGYRVAYVLDAGGNVVVESTGSPPLEPACRASVARVLSSGRPEADFHVHADGLPVLAITAPVRVADRTLGAVLLSVDPGRWLYPLLLSEPTPSATGESLLAHRVGDQIEFLSPLRHRPARPLSFRLPVNAAPLASVDAIRGVEGFKQYVDYRGVRVLGAARRIPDTGWGLVVKVDQDEAFAGFRRSVRDTALALAGLLVALAGLGFGAQRVLAGRHRRELGESEARFALLRDHANDAILFASRDGVILDVNRRAEQLYVRRREDLLGLPFDELRAPEERAALRDQLDALARDEQLVFEAVHRRPDGTRFPVEVSIRVMEIGKEEVFLSIVRDITERKRVEEALREAEERFRIASETSNDVVYEWDLKQSVQWFGNIDEMLGYDPGGFPRTLDGWAASVHPDDLEHVMGAVRAYLEKQVVYAIEYRVRKKDGTYRWWTARGTATRTPDGRPVRWIGTITDITERKRAEEALKASEALLQAAVNILPVGLWIIDAEGKIVTSSAAAQRIWAGVRYVGIDQLGEYKGWRTDSGKLIEAHEWAGARALEKGETTIEEEVEIECFDGTHKIILDSAVPLRKSDGSIGGAVTINQDITERKRADEALQQQAAELKTRNEELMRFNDAVVGRELRMVELKQQVNELCGQLGKPLMYPLGFLEAAPQAPTAAPVATGHDPTGEE